MFFLRCCSIFGFIWSQNRCQIEARVANHPKVQNPLKHWQGKQKSRFCLPGTDPKNRKSLPNQRAKKRTSKSSENVVFRSVWASLGEPKSTDFRRFLRTFRKLVSRRYGNHRKASWGSGTQRFATVSLSFQRIRSALSVSLSLC